MVWSNRPQSSDVVIPRRASAPPLQRRRSRPRTQAVADVDDDRAGTTCGPARGLRSRPIPGGPTFYPSVVWTGSEALVVGGVDAAWVSPVSPRSPTTPSPTVGGRSPNSPGGSGRINPLVAWTGTDMLVIGGDNPDGSLLVSFGEAYDPATDAWRLIASPPVGFITDRSPAAWTGPRVARVAMGRWWLDDGDHTDRLRPGRRHLAGARRATDRAAPAGRLGVDRHGVDRVGWHHRRHGARRRRRLRPGIRHVACDLRLAAVAAPGSRRVDRCGADRCRRVDWWRAADRQWRVGAGRRRRLRPGHKHLAGAGSRASPSRLRAVVDRKPADHVRQRERDRVRRRF